jgi:hypothetical protein
MREWYDSTVNLGTSSSSTPLNRLKYNRGGRSRHEHGHEHYYSCVHSSVTAVVVSRITRKQY